MCANGMYIVHIVIIIFFWFLIDFLFIMKHIIHSFLLGGVFLAALVKFSPKIEQDWERY